MFCRQHYHLSHHHHHRPHHQQIPRRNSTDVATSENLLKENFPEDHMNVFKSAALTTRPDSRMGVVGRNEIVALKIFWRILKHVVVIMPNGKTRMNSKMILKTGKSTAHQNILNMDSNCELWLAHRIYPDVQQQQVADWFSVFHIPYRGEQEIENSGGWLKSKSSGTQ